MMYCYRKAIKNDLERGRGSSLTCVKMSAGSRILPSTPNITPISDRLSVPSAAASEVKSRTSSAVKARSSLPVCGDSFFEDSDADRSHSNWSFTHSETEFSSFDVSTVKLHDASSSNVVRSHDVSLRGPSTCSVQRSPLSTVQRQLSTVTSQSLSPATTEPWLTSQRTNTTSLNSLPTSSVSRQKPETVSSAAAATLAGSSPSGWTDTLLS